MASAALVLSSAWLFYWLYQGGTKWIDGGGSGSPFTSPLLWGALILAALFSVLSRIWRKYQERRFIRSLKRTRYQAAKNEQRIHPRDSLKEPKE